MKGEKRLEERSLKVVDSNKTFFGKLSKTLSKIIIPTKIGINGFVINLKRNNLLKNYVEGDLGFEFYPQNTPAQSLPAPKSKLVTTTMVKDSISKLITVAATQPAGSNF